MQWLIALVTALAVTGCAFMTIKGPDEEYPRVRPVCTTQYRAAQLDVGVGTGIGLGMIVGGIWVADDHEPLGNSILVTGLAAFAAFYASAAIGYIRTKRCKDAISEWEFRSTDN